MRYLYHKFIEYLRSLFAKPIEMTDYDFSNAYIIEEVVEEEVEEKKVVEEKSKIQLSPEGKNYLHHNFDDYILVEDSDDNDYIKTKNKSKKVKTTITSVDEIVKVNDITRTIKVTTDDGIIEYRRTPIRTPKYDIKVGNTTFYAWGKGEVYTTVLEGENVQVISSPKDDYDFVGFGEIM